MRKVLFPTAKCCYFKPNRSSLINLKNSYSTSNSRLKNYCWKCGAERTNANMFCEKCNIIQNPQERTNYFKLFGIEQVFNIDQKILKDKFRNFQSQIHPDKFSNSSEKEQIISEEYSSLVNKAYHKLMSPMQRAEHLLQLNGENISDNQTVDEPAFLMNIMNLNEEVESTMHDMEKLRQLEQKNKTEIEVLTKEIDKHFQNRNIEGAKKSIIKLKYFSSISDRINSILREAGISE
ncbi:co-chaperone protein HscB homolog [Diorhabda carinulata]|uniref:co-chaperone protein HscB homolog n=1 Tax=Diorhabda carinulata TaxID=1163345 RepID=UPI0025A2C3D7|nr:co-chaperone protein HscB homolog [Diorhabda carinulata]